MKEEEIKELFEAIRSYCQRIRRRRVVGVQENLHKC